MNRPRIDPAFAATAAKEIEQMNDVDIGRSLSGGYGEDKRRDLMRKIKALAAYHNGS